MTTRDRRAVWRGRPVIAARAYWTARLQAGPLPCVRCGQDVTLDHAWQVDHVVSLLEGGAVGRANQGVAHTRCNASHGGRLAHLNRRARTRAERRLRPFPGLP